MSSSNFNPRNTSSIPVVKIFAFLEIEPQLNIKIDLTGQAKIKLFQKFQKAPYSSEFAVFVGAKRKSRFQREI